MLTNLARISRFKPAVAVTLLLALPLMGCSGGDSKAEKSDKSADPTASANPVPEEGLPMDWPAGVAKVKGFKPVTMGVGAATFGNCDIKKGVQKVKGTITSDAKETRDFAAIVTWIDRTGKQVASGSQIVTGVEPGASFDVKIKAELPKKAQSCIPNVYAGVAKAQP